MPRPGRLLFGLLKRAVPHQPAGASLLGRWQRAGRPGRAGRFPGTLLSQHISFLRNVFRVYKGFDTPHIDTLELMVERLYQKWNITDRTDFAGMQPKDYPILSDLYNAIQEGYDHYDAAEASIRGRCCRDLLLGLHSTPPLPPPFLI